MARGVKTNAHTSSGIGNLREQRTTCLRLSRCCWQGLGICSMCLPAVRSFTG